MRSWPLAICVFLLASSAGLAMARPPEGLRLAPVAPVALLVDGVKVGSTETFQIPKSEPVRVGSSCSSCTVVVTY